MLNQTYCSPAISVMYRNNEMGHPMVSYNRARIVLYGDIVCALTVMSISFTVVKKAPVLWFPFLSEPKGRVYRDGRSLTSLVPA